MSIEAVSVPTRSRLWTEQDAKQAYDLLTGGPVYVTDEDGQPVLDDDGNPTPVLDDDGNPVVREPQAAKFATYEGKGDKVESKARTQGMSLDRLINSLYGRRFGVSVWVDQDGNTVGAMVPQAPRTRNTNGASAPAKKASGGSRASAKK